MKRIAAWSASITLVLCRLAMAQQLSAVDVFAGYSHYWQSTNHIHGWGASAALNINRWISVAGDSSGHYFPEQKVLRRTVTETSNLDQYRIYAGPRLSIRKMEKLTPSVHLLLGLVHSHRTFSGIRSDDLTHEVVPYSGSESKNDFSGAIGVTLDVKATEQIAVRLIQADYVRDADNRGRSSGLRLGSGVVFVFGAR